MKFLKSLTTSIAVCIGLLGYSQNWTEQNTGMYSALVSSIFAEDSTVIIGTNNPGGIFVSHDYGNSWQHSLADRDDESAKRFISKNDTIYAASDLNGLIRSTDRGDSWQVISMPYGNGIDELLLIGDTIMAGTYSGIYITVDGGENWVSSNSGIPLQNGAPWPIVKLSKIGSIVYAGLSYGGACRSIDGGETWEVLSDIPSDGSVLGFAEIDNITYLTSRNNVFASADQGVSWVMFGDTFNSDIYDLDVFGDRIYLTTNYGLYQSDDNASSWTKVVLEDISDNSNMRAMTVSEDGLYLGTWSYGIQKSSDGGTTWKSSNSGLMGNTITGFAVDHKYIYASGNGGTFRSVSGREWESANGNVSRIDEPLVKGDSLIGSGSYYSTDHGDSWEWMGRNGLPGGLQNPLGVYKGNIYSTLSQKLFVLRNGNSDWEDISPVEGESYSNMYDKGDTLIVGTWSNSIYMSVDSGNNWKLLKDGISEFIITHSLGGISNKFLAGLNNNKVYSLNAGDSIWQPVGLNKTIRAFWTDTTENLIFAGSVFDGIWFSPDEGNSWIEFNNDETKNQNIEKLITYKNTVFAGSTRGVWATPISDFFPTIETFEPAQGEVGTAVTIQGSNFSSLPEWSKVKINDLEAEVLLATDKSIVLKIPEKARRGAFTVTVNNHSVSSLNDFCVIPEKPTFKDSISDEQVTYLISDFPNGNMWYLDDQLLEGRDSSILELRESGTYKLRRGIDGCLSDFTSSMDYCLPIDQPQLNVKPNEDSFDILYFDHPALSNPITRYHWYRNGLLSGTPDDSTFTLSKSGIYELIIEIDSCFSPVSDTLDYCFPHAKPSIELDGKIGSDLLVSSADDFNQWYHNDILLIGETEKVLEPLKSGYYSTKLIDGRCESEESEIYHYCLDYDRPLIFRSVEGNTPMLISSALENNYWYLEDTLFAGPTSSKFIPDVSGSFSVRIVEDSCFSDFSDPVEFCIALDQPTITESVSSDSLPVLIAAGYQIYRWFLDDVELMAEGDTLFPTLSGSYTVQGVLDRCKSERSQPLKFCRLIPTPVITHSYNENGINMLSSTLDSGHVWYLNGELIESIGQTIEAKESGIYTVQIVEGACISPVSANLDVLVLSNGQKDSREYKVYPNPAAEFVEIQYYGFRDSDKKVQILSLDGKIIFNEKWPGTNINSNINLEISTIPKGVYVIQILDNLNGVVYSDNLIRK